MPIKIHYRLPIMSHYRFKHRLSIVDAIAALYRYSVNDFYSKSGMLSIMVPILTIYMLSIKSLYSYLNTYPIFCPIGCLYRLTIINLYRDIYTKSICLSIKLSINGLHILVFPVWNAMHVHIFCLHHVISLPKDLLWLIQDSSPLVISR